MKRNFLSIVFAIILLFCCFACNGGEGKCSLVTCEENRVVILVEETDGKATLLNCMESLAEENAAFTYTMEGGMITEINGKKNAVDFSSCWMLYTSDAEMSNTEWGTVEYEGESIGSAILGAESLVVTEGEVYIWVYQTF